MATDTSILESGATCGRLEKVEQGAFLIDGRDYYRAFRSALRQAEQSVVILAWDLHSELRLERERDDGYPEKLGPFLRAILEEKPALHIHVLVWDYSVIYLVEREWAPFSKWLGTSHPRLHFELDDELPAGASHHQKVVVVDGALAFAGGMDLSAWRWDTPEHRAEDERRLAPDGKRYPPIHDVQMALAGPVVDALRKLCAERWERATGETLPPLGERRDGKPWPEDLPVDFRDLEVGLAHTYAPFEPYDPCREIEALHLRLIEKAHRYLYLENQYLSSHRIVDAMIRRLEEPEGPEIILVLTQDTNGWIEEQTMGLLRNRLLERLHEADLHDRFRSVYPKIEDDQGGEVMIYVHAKVVIMDDRVVKVGSANLSNRSMRMDSEIDLVLAEEESFEASTLLLHRLLAEHLGREPREIEVELKESGSLRALLDAHRDDAGRTLRPLHYGCENDAQRQLADSRLLDPDEPIDPAYWIRQAVPAKQRSGTLRRLLIITGAVAVGLTLAALLRWGWGQVIDQEAAIALLEQVRASPWSAIILTGLFLVAGLTGISLNVLLVASAIVLSPWIALGAGIVGGHLSALIGFGLGHRWGKPLLRRFAPARVGELSERLADRGVLSVALVRLVPVAPFPVINLAAGSSHLRFSVFNLGTLLGMVPGMLGVVLVADRTAAAVQNPDRLTIATLIGSVVLIGAAIWFIRRALQRRRKGS